MLELLAISPSLRQELGLTDKLPHYSTLAKFSSPQPSAGNCRRDDPQHRQAAFGQSPEPTAAAMDATGLETTTASAHFQCRRGGQRRKWVKVSTIILCGSLLADEPGSGLGADQ